MITEDYVSFETAKLLKEKGFNNLECGMYYSITTGKRTTELLTSLIACPTLQMAMKWLREVHGIFIGISLCERYENKMDNDTTIMFFFELLNLKEKQLINGFFQEYTHTYEQACEAAIQYCLTNLI